MSDPSRPTPAAVLLAGALTLMPVASTAQERYPAQPVQVIMPFSAGGGVDILARVLAAEFGRLFGQSFVVVTRDGAAGSVGFGVLAQAKPDGYTIASSPATPMTNVPHLQKSLPYTFDSFVPVCQTFENVYSIVVSNASPYRTLKDLLDDARARPDGLSYGSVGLGSIPHLSVAALAKASGVRLNLVPYRGDSQMLPTLISGELPFGAAAISSIVGRGMRVLAVFGDKRHPAVPDAPASSELGIPYIPPGLNGVFVPRGTPQGIVDALERACDQATQTEAFRAQAEKLNGQVAYLNRADFTRRLREDYELKGRIVRELNLRQE
jgi:tripartite-type tricarboxylate transporter receptor subunit TctC